MYILVEYDDALESRTSREDTASFVLLVLFAYKKKSNLGIANHKLDLLL